MKRWAQLLGLILLCQGVGALGAWVTVGSVNSWYAEIAKPSFNPPGWIFGPVWTVLYIMMAAACWLVLKEEAHQPFRRQALVLFGVQLFLNGLWSPLFFGMKQPGLALLDIAALWVMIGLCARAFLKVSRPAGMLLLPYWAWVSFAALLNFSIWRLN